MGKPASTATTAPDAVFLALSRNWMRDQAELLLGFVWTAYDTMRANMPGVDGRDLERSITQFLEPRIKDAMSGDEPFYVQHSPFEHETMAPPPAQPPAYDIAFVLRAEERFMWPIEAKVLETPGTVAAYERDVRQEFLTCRYGPFTEEGAMVGYLLSGLAIDALTAIEKGLGCALDAVPAFASRPHRASSHKRTVPMGKNYPINFRCHHLILEFPSVTRSKK